MTAEIKKRPSKAVLKARKNAFKSENEKYGSWRSSMYISFPPSPKNYHLVKNTISKAKHQGWHWNRFEYR
jgi:hypothetical protein